MKVRENKEGIRKRGISAQAKTGNNLGGLAQKDLEKLEELCLKGHLRNEEPGTLFIYF